MKSTLVLLLGFILLTVSINAEEGTKYGKEIELKEITNISKIVESPADFLGKKVLVEGTIVDVCSKMGCWIELTGENESETIKVKVEDGEIVFPTEAKGKTALVEGEVYSMEVEAEHKCDHKEGEACKCGGHEKEVKTVYQIKGSGAVIK